VFLPPETHYTSVGEDRIAYQVLGDGPPDLVWLGPWWSHVDGKWEEPRFCHFLRRLAGFSRLITFDRRGTGASDRWPVERGGTWEEWMQDVLAVMTAANSGRAVVCGVIDSGAVAILLAATRPELVERLVVVNSAARFMLSDDYPWGAPPEFVERFIQDTFAAWGQGAQLELTMPSRANDAAFRRWWDRYQRMAGSPRTAADQLRIMLASDCREALPAVHVPTLVIHRTDILTIGVQHGRYLADNIPDANLLELPGADVGVFGNDTDAVVDAIEEFVTGQPPVWLPDRALATVVFTDIAGSTGRLVQIGDTLWGQLIDQHDAISRRVVEAHGGILVKATGDGALATFTSANDALSSSTALRDALQELGLAIRVGVHAGEIDLRESDVGGLTVHIASRVNAQAQPDEVLATEAVRGITVGTRFVFAERGRRSLRAIPGEWPLYAVSRV
jgi:pimeloyl-ACP methyl ester carboxylesterase